MNESLWKRVEAALDARIDPYSDPQLAADLAQAPEIDRATQRLCQRLAQLPLAEPHQRASGRSRAARFRLPLVAAAVAAGILVAISIDRSAATGDLDRSEPRFATEISLVVEHFTPDPPRIARVTHAPRRIVAWTVEGEAR